ncbi:MAG: TIGR02710 family CRISPR-associated CARF protein [bacterium]|nr:TIGR02710 family CRISPR-associated CARF protein [bacterium]
MNKPSARAIIMTVGLPGDQGGNVLDALQLDLDTLKPDRLILIASAQSQANAQRLAERSGLESGQCEIVLLDSAHDMDEVFRRTNAVIEQLVARGYTPEQIAIDYTSGTKVMGSGAVLSAVYNRIMELRYVTGLASAHLGPERARHRILTTKPGAVFAYQELINGRAMMLDLRFRSACAALETVQEDLLTPRDRRLRLSLLRLARAYDEWENFYPDRFLELYTGVAFEGEGLEVFRMSEEQLAGVRGVAGERAAGTLGPHIITDLYNNAVRRLAAGRTDDAMARVYRALEMLGQWVLARDFGLDINDVDSRRIPPRDRIGFEALRSLDDGMIRIGMRKAYDLLIILDAPVGRKLLTEPVIREFLDRRTGSILAHGLLPVEPDDGRRYMGHAYELLKVEIPTLDQLARRIQFPWLIRPGGAAGGPSGE